MSNSTRKLFTRQLKQLKCHRKISASATLRTNEYIIKSPLNDAVIPDTRFFDRFWSESGSYKNLVALECAETKKQYTYTQLERNMAVFATSLHTKLGLKAGDVVAVMLPNCPEFPVVALGCLQAGCVVTTINPVYKEAEISHQTSLTAPKVFVTIPECYDTVTRGLKNAKIDPKIVIIDKPNTAIPNGTIRYSEIAENGEADYSLLEKIERSNDDLAFVPFSSGTTGLPKGVEITYKNIISSLYIGHCEANCYATLANNDYQDVVPCVLPFFHIYGLVVTLLLHLSKGCKLVTLPRFTPDLYFKTLKEDKATILYVVPPLAMLLGKHPDVTDEHFQNVKYICCGAAPLSASDVEGIFEKTKRDIEFCQGYGTTETCALTTATYKNTRNVDYSSSGYPLANMEMKFVDPVSGSAMPVGESGELHVRGPVIMKGYYKNEEATKESLTADGWFKTGDMGHFSPGHGLYITDRIKELIKVKGMQVAPAELESLLRSHPAVQDAAVIGVPHEFNGEAPKAFIIPKNNATISPEELQRFVASKVASYKKIEHVVFVNDIPKTSSGKILRRELKKYG